MNASAAPFDVLDSSLRMHRMLAEKMRAEELHFDLIWHGVSGIISVFAPGDWHGKADAVCDIYPAQDHTWVVEWLDGKVMNGKGGDAAFAEVLVQGIKANLKWTAHGVPDGMTVTPLGSGGTRKGAKKN